MLFKFQPAVLLQGPQQMCVRPPFYADQLQQIALGNNSFLPNAKAPVSLVLQVMWIKCFYAFNGGLLWHANITIYLIIQTHDLYLRRKFWIEKQILTLVFILTNKFISCINSGLILIIPYCRWWFAAFSTETKELPIRPTQLQGQGNPQINLQPSDKEYYEAAHQTTIIIQIPMSHQLVSQFA